MKKVSNLSVIRKFTTQLKSLKLLTADLQHCLPEEWIPYCEIVRADVAQKKLVLSTSEQTLLMPLRFRQNQLLAQLIKKHKALKEITTIECIYTPLPNLFATHKRELLNSHTAAKACQGAAAQCPPALQEALMKLGKTLGESS